MKTLILVAGLILVTALTASCGSSGGGVIDEPEPFDITGAYWIDSSCVIEWDRAWVYIRTIVEYEIQVCSPIPGGNFLDCIDKNVTRPLESNILTGRLSNNTLIEWTSPDMAAGVFDNGWLECDVILTRMEDER